MDSVHSAESTALLVCIPDPCKVDIGRDILQVRAAVDL